MNTNQFNISENELLYLKEIHSLINEGKNLSYVVGIDKSNNERRLFLIHADNEVDPPIVYAICEILKEDSSIIDNVLFEFSEDYLIKKEKRNRNWYDMFKFWK